MLAPVLFTGDHVFASCSAAADVPAVVDVPLIDVVIAVALEVLPVAAVVLSVCCCCFQGCQQRKER